MRAILYARVSTDEQSRHGYSIDDHLRVLRERAKSEGYEAVEEGIWCYLDRVVMELR